MKIGMIGPYPISKDCIKGGVESSVYGLVKELKKTYEVVVFDRPRIGGVNSVQIEDGVKVYRHQNKGKMDNEAAKEASAIIAEIKSENIDICHIHYTNKLSYKLLKPLSQNNIKTLVTIHGLSNEENKKVLKNKFSLKVFIQTIFLCYYQFKAISRCSKIIVDTEYVKNNIEQCYKKRYISRLPEIYVIPQGINEKYLELHCSESSKTILSVGVLSKRKGHLYLLQAFDKLCQTYNDINIIIAGANSDYIYYSALKDYIDSSVNKDRIKLISNVDQESLNKLFETAHIYALHSEEESQGIAIIEAMATGLPVVSTMVGGIPYVVDHNKTGLLSEYTNVSAFAESLDLLIKNPLIWRDMSYNAHKAAESYKWSVITQNILKVYNDII